jgi:multidrug efflux pump
VATILLTAGVALCGAAAFMLLPVAPLPRIDVPAIFVSASCRARAPRSWRARWRRPLERHLGAIADVDDMTSTSGVGTTNIQLTFGVGPRHRRRGARRAGGHRRRACRPAVGSLTHNPSYRKLNSALFPSWPSP